MTILAQDQVAAMAKTVVDWFHSHEREAFELTHADTTIGTPIITALTEQLGWQSAHIEWQGVAEFKLVPIFDYHEVTGKTFAHNVNLDGTIDSFNCD